MRFIRCPLSCTEPNLSLPPFNTHLPMFAPHGANVYLAAEIKKHVSKPVATIGGQSQSIIERLLQEGYTFVPISEIILKGEYTIDHTGRQCPG